MSVMSVVFLQAYNASNKGARNVTTDLQLIASAQTSLQHAVKAVRGAACGVATSDPSYSVIKAHLHRVTNSSSQLYAAMANYFVRTLEADDGGQMSQDLRDNDRALMDQTVRQMDGNTKSICDLTIAFAKVETGKRDRFRTLNAESSLSWGCSSDFADDAKPGEQHHQTSVLYGQGMQAGPPVTTVLSPSYSPYCACSTSVQAPFALVASAAKRDSLVETIRGEASGDASRLEALRNQLLLQQTARLHVFSKFTARPGRVVSSATKGQQSLPPPSFSTILLVPFGANKGTDPRNAKGFGSSAKGRWHPLVLRSINWAQRFNQGFFTGRVLFIALLYLFVFVNIVDNTDRFSPTFSRVLPKHDHFVADTLCIRFHLRIVPQIPRHTPIIHMLAFL